MLKNSLFIFGMIMIQKVNRLFIVMSKNRQGDSSKKWAEKELHNYSHGYCHCGRNSGNYAFIWGCIWTAATIHQNSLKLYYPINFLRQLVPCITMRRALTWYIRKTKYSI